VPIGIFPIVDILIGAVYIRCAKAMRRLRGAKLALFEVTGYGYLWEAEDEANQTVHDFLHRNPLQTWRRLT